MFAFVVTIAVVAVVWFFAPYPEPAPGSAIGDPAAPCAMLTVAPDNRAVAVDLDCVRERFPEARVSVTGLAIP
jgi:hypothetical protein